MSKAITPKVRFSYLHVFTPKPTPNGELKYSVSMMLPKEDAEGMARMQSAIQEAIKEGLEKGTIVQRHVPGLRLPFRDGDAEIKLGKRTKEYEGMIFLNGSTKNPPGVIDQFKQPGTEESVYSGCYGYGDVSFFAYNVNGNIGIGCGLNNLMKCADGERLDGRRSADEAFGDIAASEVDDKDDEEVF